MVWSHTSGELQLAMDVMTVLFSTNSSPKRIFAMATVSSARSRAVTMPMKGLSECLMRPVDHVEMTLRDGHVHRFAQHAAGKVHGRRHMSQFREGVEIGEGAVAAPAFEIENVGRTVGRREDLLHPTQCDRARPITGNHGVTLGHRGDQLQQLAPFDTHPVALDPRSGGLPESRAFIVPELDSLGLEQRHCRVVDAPDLVRRHEVDHGNPAVELGQEADRPLSAGLLARVPPATLARFVDSIDGGHRRHSLSGARLLPFGRLAIQTPPVAEPVAGILRLTSIPVAG